MILLPEDSQFHAWRLFSFRLFMAGRKVGPISRTFVVPAAYSVTDPNRETQMIEAEA